MSTVAHLSPVGGSHPRTSTPQAQRLRRSEESLRNLSGNYLDTHRRLDRTSRIVRGSLENVSRYHNPQLADPVQAQAFMEHEFAPRAMGARYDWLYEYDALTVPV